MTQAFALGVPRWSRLQPQRLRSTLAYYPPRTPSGLLTTVND